MDNQDKWSRYASCIVFVIDSADQGHYEVSKIQLQQLLQSPSVAGVPLLVLGNKNDLSGSLDEKGIIEVMELNSIKDRDVACYSISCKNMNNIDNVLKWLGNLKEKK